MYKEHFGMIISSNSFVSNMVGNAERDNIKFNIQQWLKEEGYTATDRTKLGTSFQLATKDAMGFTIGIVQPVEAKDKIILVGGIKFFDEDKQKIMGIGKDRLRSFLWELRFALLERGVAFGSIDPIGNGIHLNMNVYFEELNKPMLMERISYFSRALTYIKWMFDREIGEQEPRATVSKPDEDLVYIA